jgi:hypothetical protein
MKEPIVQHDEFGCGVACAAFVAGESYGESLEAMGEEFAKWRGYYCRDIAKFLKSKGFEYNFCYAKPAKHDLAYSEGSIVFTVRSIRHPAGHYMVRHGDLWMDPWINYRPGARLTDARAGYRKRLPGKIQYILYKKA